MRTAITAVALATILTSCSAFDSGSNWQSGQFEVIWIDLQSDSHLAYRLDSSTSIGIVESCVFAAGANAQYIVVKQRPANSAANVLYYVVVKAKYNPLRESPEAVIGPLLETEFMALSRSMTLPALEPVIPKAACTAA